VQTASVVTLFRRVILLKDFGYSSRRDYVAVTVINAISYQFVLMTWNDLVCQLSDRNQILSPIISIVSNYLSRLSFLISMPR